MLACGPKGLGMFGKPKPANLNRTLVGEWHADTLRGEVKGEITAIFHNDGTFMTCNKMEVRGVPAHPVTQTGRYRVEAMDKQRFKLFTIDENGAPISTTIRGCAPTSRRSPSSSTVPPHRRLRCWPSGRSLPFQR